MREGKSNQSKIKEIHRDVHQISVEKIQGTKHRNKTRTNTQKTYTTIQKAQKREEEGKEAERSNGQSVINKRKIIIRIDIQRTHPKMECGRDNSRTETNRCNENTSYSHKLENTQT